MNEINARVLDVLSGILQERVTADPASSYTASLFHKGLDTILKKVGEESVEVILAAKGENSQELTHEVADLLYHVMVLLVAKGIPAEAVWHELQRRFGTSGHEEKASRKITA